jgi:hypothetical protein
VQLGIFVDGTIDPQQQSLRLERRKMGLEIERRSAWRSFGSARVSAHIEHGWNLKKSF